MSTMAARFRTLCSIAVLCFITSLLMKIDAHYQGVITRVELCLTDSVRQRSSERVPRHYTMLREYWVKNELLLILTFAQHWERLISLLDPGSSSVAFIHFGVKDYHHRHQLWHEYIILGDIFAHVYASVIFLCYIVDLHKTRQWDINNQLTYHHQRTDI